MAARPPAPARPPVQGGPFQRVVYNVKTHVAIAVPGFLRQSNLVFRSAAVRYNDLSQLASSTGPCSITNGPALATAGSATADFARHMMNLSGGVQFTWRDTTPGRDPVNLIMNCPVVSYRSDAGVVQCTGGVRLDLQEPEPDPVHVSVNCPAITYQDATREAHCTGGVRLTLQEARPGQDTITLVINSPAATYQASTQEAHCIGGVKLTLSHSRPGQQPVTMAIDCPQVDYQVKSREARCTGGVQLNLQDTRPGQEPVTLALRCPEMTYQAATRNVQCVGGVNFNLAAGRQGQEPIRMSINCPILTYQASDGMVRCKNGVSGNVLGVEGIPEIAHSDPGSRRAPARGPVAVQSRELVYNTSTRVVQGLGEVQLVQSRAVVRAQGLALDMGRHTLRMSGDVHYTDSVGRKFAGRQVDEDLQTRNIHVMGPVTYSDEKKNIVRSQSATMEEQGQLATFSGEVHFTNAEGTMVQTPYVAIHFEKDGSQSVQTGPLRIIGTASEL